MADPRLEELVRLARERNPSVNRDLLERAIRHAIYLERLKTHEVNNVIGFLNDDVFPDIIAQVESRLSRIEERGGVDSGPWTTKRYQDMKEAVAGLTSAGFQQAGEDLQKRLGNVAISEADYHAATIKEAMPVDFEFTIPNPALLRSIVADQPFQGHILKDWFGGLDLATQARVEKEINLGLASGETVQQMVGRLRGTKEQEGVLEITRRDAEAVVRTAVAHTTNAASIQTYKENADLIKGLKIVATLDAKTTPICQALDGTFIKIEDVDASDLPPFHYNCRTRTSPVLRSYKDLGLDIKELPPGTRASMNGQVPETLNYNEWLKTQPAEFQDDVLGPTRGQLFRERNIDVNRFVDENHRPLTLEEIRKREGLDVEEKLYPVGTPAGIDTYEKFQDPNTGDWTPERKKLHEEIIAKIMANAKTSSERRALFLGGGPASGKSSILDGGLIDLPPDYVKVDPDEMKKLLPEFGRLVNAGDLGAASYTHEESSYLAKKLADALYAKGVNVVYDGTGDGSLASLSKKINLARAAGYKIEGAYVAIDTDEAWRRALKRALKGPEPSAAFKPYSEVREIFNANESDKSLFAEEIALENRLSMGADLAAAIEGFDPRKASFAAQTLGIPNKSYELIKNKPAMEALKAYIEGSGDVNTLLRNMPEGELPSGGDPAAVIQDLIQRQEPVPERLVTYRFATNDIDKKIGNTWTARGFLSSGLAPMDPFLDKGKIAETVAYEIVIPKGAKGVLTGFNTQELEVLIAHGSKFRVVGVGQAAFHSPVDGEFKLKTYRLELITDANIPNKGRLPAETVVRDTHRAISEVFPQVVDRGLFDKVSLYDNMGDEPRLVMKSVGADKTIVDEAAWQRFLAKADPGFAPGGGNKLLADIKQDPTFVALEQRLREADVRHTQAVMQIEAEKQDGSQDNLTRFFEKNNRAIEEASAAAESIKKYIQAKIAVQAQGTIGLAGTQGPGWNPSLLAKADEGRAFVQSILAAKGDRHFTVNASVTESFRSGFRVQRSPSEEIIDARILLSFAAKPEHMAHELGHALQFYEPRARELTKAFLEKRLAADKRGVRPLSEIKPEHSYSPKEQAVEDKFIDPYMGRIYPEGANADEILSMGIEMLMTNPHALLARDPEFFALIINVMRGVYL